VAVRERRRLSGCDGFGVLTPLGLVGWVEELWLDASNEPVAVAVRLLDGRRGLLFAAEIDEVAAERRTVSIGDGARILELEPPHLLEGAPEGPQALTASWRATGTPLLLPDPPGRLREALISLHRPTVAVEKRERPILQLAAAMYAVLVLIACSLIGLDILVAYLATGGPPY
jgi:hypothetical protein